METASTGGSMLRSPGVVNIGFCIDCGEVIGAISTRCHSCANRKARIGRANWSKGLTKETDERIRRRSEAIKKVWADPERAKKQATAIIVGVNRKPTYPEKVFDQVTPKEVWYSGDAKYFVNFKNGKIKNPDFKLLGQNKVVEVFGDHWHKVEEKASLIRQYKRAGFDCLVIWEHEIYSSLQEVLNKVMEFING